jgi:hypothetical protein
MQEHVQRGTNAAGRLVNAPSSGREACVKIGVLFGVGAFDSAPRIWPGERGKTGLISSALVGSSGRDQPPGGRNYAGNGIQACPVAWYWKRHAAEPPRRKNHDQRTQSRQLLVLLPVPPVIQAAHGAVCAFVARERVSSRRPLRREPQPQAQNKASPSNHRLHRHPQPSTGMASRPELFAARAAHPLARRL